MGTPADLAVLFTAVLGTDSDSEDAAIAAVLADIARSVARHRGTVVKQIGPELMASFPSADAAAEAAIEMSGLAAAPLSVRTGFHFGTVDVQEDGDLFGDTVSIAARLGGGAKRSGRILVSGQTLERLSPGLRAAARQVQGIETKNFRLEIHDLGAPT